MNIKFLFILQLEIKNLIFKTINCFINKKNLILFIIK